MTDSDGPGKKDGKPRNSGDGGPGKRSGRRRNKRRRPASAAGEGAAQGGSKNPAAIDGQKQPRRRRRRSRKSGADGEQPRQGQQGSKDSPSSAANEKASTSKRTKRSRRRRRRPDEAAGGQPPDRQAAARTPREDRAGPVAPPVEEIVLPPPEPEVIAENADDLVLELELDPDAPPPTGHLANVVQVHFKDQAKNIAFDAGGINVEAGEQVVVESDQGMLVGTCSCRSCRAMVSTSLPRMIRRLDHNDLRQQARNHAREKEAFAFCVEKIHHRNLSMKLIRVEYLHSGNKAIFFFSAENRVDFRELVKDLAQKFHTRIVMRQVGVRDEAKMTGGIGSCGNQLCCSSWLSKFEPVSIRMAKDQNLVLNPQKVSGQCSRLKCCLTYEQDQYREARRGLPKPGRMVMTPDGEGKVQDLDILCRLVAVHLRDGLKVFPADQIQKKPRPETKPKPG